MNDEAMRGAAEERLLTAELAEVMGGATMHSTKARRPWRQLPFAALMLLGTVVTLGVAWLARTPDALGQEPRFDPVDPWYEREWPFQSMAALMKPVSADQAGPEVDQFAVTLRGEDAPELAAVLDRPVVRRLALSWRNDAVVANVSDAQWQRLVARPDLESLMLAGRFAFSPERLRDLRLLPRLRYLLLVDGAVTLDLATARALAELPHLRGLTLASGPIQADAMQALGALPHLEFLGLSSPQVQPAALASALPHLRTLRALLLEQSGREPFIDAALLRSIATLPRLVALDLCFAELDDAALAALPTRLELLGLGDVERCTAAGIGSLRRLESLRTLRLRKSIAAHLPAMLDVMRAAPLARFDLLVGTLEASVWEVLREKAQLRRLTVRAPATANLFREASACARLEELTVITARLPQPAHLAPLRDHPTLRRIVLQDVNIDPSDFPAEELAALRASVAVPIDVRMR